MLAASLREMRRNRDEMRKAVDVARPAMARLAEVMKGRSGQPYYLRALLFSLYNGKPTPLVQIVHFDWSIRKDLAAVLAVFGCGDGDWEFFYDALRAAVKASGPGQWDWFTSEEIEPLREWLHRAEGR